MSPNGSPIAFSSERDGNRELHLMEVDGTRPVRQKGLGLSTATEPVIGLPCEGCEAVFDGLPASLTADERIAPLDEPGEPLVIEGTVYDEGGHPAAGIIVYAYHTNAHGVYPRDDRFSGMAARHGRLRGWAQTDAEGHYRFQTIRPASYPDGETPAHVHMHIIEPGCCTYYIDSIHFEDDPRLTADERRKRDDARGGSGLVQPQRTPGEVWVVRRDIVLGRVVPGYRGHDSRELRSRNGVAEAAATR